MPVYIIARMKIHDREGYDRYQEGFMPIFEKFRGKLLSVDEDPQVLQGEWHHTRSILMEFPDKQSAYDWMMSPEYQELAKHRFAASEGEAILVESFEAGE